MRRLVRLLLLELELLESRASLSLTMVETSVFLVFIAELGEKEVGIVFIRKTNFSEFARS